MNRTQPGLTLALGGGGARGFAHVGVVEVLAERGVRINAVWGTSSGAMAGAGCALGEHPAKMRRMVLEFAKSPLAQEPKVRAMVKQCEDNVCRSLGDRVGRIFCRGQMAKNLFLSRSVLPPDFFQGWVNFFLPEVDIESLPVPFAAVATDVMTGQGVVLDQGPLRRAVLASSSVPGVAPPLEVDGRWLVDGGVSSLVPTLEARARGARNLVAVSVDRQADIDQPPGPALEVYLRAGDIQAAHLAELQLRQADLVLRPSVGHIHWADFGKAQLIMDLGREAALEAWPRIERLLDDRLGDRLGRAWRVGRRVLAGQGGQG